MFFLPSFRVENLILGCACVEKTGIVLINPIASTHGTGIFTYIFTTKINQCHLGEYTVRPKDGSESTSTVPHIFVKNPFVGCRGVVFYKELGEFPKTLQEPGKITTGIVFAKSITKWLVIYPRCSMYGVFTYIYPVNYPNVGKYGIYLH